MIAQGVNSVRHREAGPVARSAGAIGTTTRSATTSTTAGRCSSVSTRTSATTGRCRRGFSAASTDRFSKVFNEIRVDREMLAIDAVEVYNDRRDANADGIPDLVAEADRGTGTIICNVQRYNPTAAQLQRRWRHSRAGRAGRRLARQRQPDRSRADSVARGSGRDPELRADEHLRQGNVSAAAARLRGLAEVGRQRGHARVRRGAVHGRHLGRLRTRARSRWPSAPHGASNGSGSAVSRKTSCAYGPPKHAPSLGIRGIQGGFSNGSPNLHEFSTVPTIQGGYDVWELFTEFNMPLWARIGGERLGARRGGDGTRTTRRAAESPRGSSASTSRRRNSCGSGPRSRATFARPTFAERFDVQGGGGSVRARDRNTVPGGHDVPDHEHEHR